MNVLLGSSLLIILVVTTLLILDYLIPACTSTFRPCFTIAGIKWIATKEKRTREESKNFCDSRNYQTANIEIAKEIFSENKEILDRLGNFWIIGKLSGKVTNKVSS